MRNLRLLVGITGSVGVLNMPIYLPILKAHYPKMKVALTHSTSRFITKEAIAVLVNDVYSDLFPASNEKGGSYIELADWADLMVILPTTANFIAQTANGFADTLLAATALSHTQPIIFIPNMNKTMWNNPALRKNIALLQDYGHKIVPFVRQKTFEVFTKDLREEFCMPPVDAVIQLINEEAKNRIKLEDAK